MSGSFRCAVASAQRAEPLFGTASAVSRWLLVEQPGPWGPSAFPESRLDPRVGESLQRQARALGARPLLVRRHGSGAEAQDGPRSVFVVDSRPGAERVLHRTVATEAELEAIPLDGGWRRLEGPLFLVCTHGRHDTCCAMRGRPVAAALEALDPERLWECSHLGGDRFASNTLVLPHGLYYGRLDGESAPTMAAATRQGRVLPEFLRGRSSISQPAQAAQHFAHAELGRTGLDDLMPIGEEELEPGTHRVVLRDAAGEAVVTVRRTRDGLAEQLTCHALVRNVAPLWELLRLDVPVPA
jgi:hypothetical protein